STNLLSNGNIGSQDLLEETEKYKEVNYPLMRSKQKATVLFDRKYTPMYNVIFMSLSLSLNPGSKTRKNIQ
ncbi:hypothetical protein, partial [Salmonella enterica]|uniref:hypothetical protein n=1 Tax=Salmonella enterica TaxID=28901 RepID=UPI003297B07E